MGQAGRTQAFKHQACRSGPFSPSGLRHARTPIRLVICCHEGDDDSLVVEVVRAVEGDVEDGAELDVALGPEVRVGQRVGGVLWRAG